MSNELSLSYLIGFIIGGVLFILGLIILFNLMLAAKEVGFPDEFKIAVDNCMQLRSKVCLPKTKAQVKIGDTEQFGAVITNNLEYDQNFLLKVDYLHGRLKDGEDAPVQDINQWTLPPVSVKISKAKQQYLNIPVKVPVGTPKGTYMFIISVCVDNDMNVQPAKCTDQNYKSLYSPTDQITIIVP